MTSILSANEPEIMHDLCAFVSNYKLDADSSVEEMNARSQEYLDSMPVMTASEKTEFVEQLSQFSFFDPQKFVSRSEQTETELCRMMVTLSLFKHAVVDMLKGPQETIDFGPLTRKVSPSLEAYRYTGVSKLDIGNSKRSYGCLFD